LSVLLSKYDAGRGLFTICLIWELIIPLIDILIVPMIITFATDFRGVFKNTIPISTGAITHPLPSCVKEKNNISNTAS